MPATARASDGPSSTVVDLELDDYSDLELDEANGRIFVSQGIGSVVHVYNLVGELDGYLTDVQDANDLHLSHDGSTLWVALEGSRVAKFDAETLARLDTIIVPGSCPTSVTETAGMLVIGSRNCGGDSLFVHNLATGEQHASSDGLFYRPVLDSAPGRPGIVIGSDAGLSPATIYRYDVSSGVPILEDSRWNIGSNLGDLAMTPDGKRVVTASGSPYEHPQFNVSGLTRSRVYESTNYPNAVEWSPDGGYVATGSSSSYGIDVRLHERGTPQPVMTFELGGTKSLATGGLAVADGAEWVWALTESWTGGEYLYELHVLAGLGNWPTCNGLRPTHVGSHGDDTIVGTNGDDVILARSGNDTIHLGLGNDVVCAGRGNDMIITNEEGAKFISGGPGSDTISAEAMPGSFFIDLSAGGYSTDMAEATFTSIENAIGSFSESTLLGDDGPNRLHGGPGQDIIVGGGGNDKLFGYDGADLMIGEDGDDKLKGGNGDDTMAGGRGNDLLKGGSGLDTASYFDAPQGVIIDLPGKSGTGDGNDKLKSMEWAVGSPFDDMIIGKSGQTVAEGRDGNDTILGKSGTDYLSGGVGTDTVRGGFGVDICISAEVNSGCEELRSAPIEVRAALEQSNGRGEWAAWGVQLDG